MRKLISAICALFLFASPLFAEQPKPEIKEKLIDISYLVDAGNALGSCTLFAKDERNFAWTAGHVVAVVYRTRTVFGEDGEVKEEPYFDPIHVVRQVTDEKGHIIGYESYEAKVVVADFKRDIALLRVSKKLVNHKLEFETGVPEQGRELVHVGSRYGFFGIRSFNLGFLGQLGITLPDYPDEHYDLVNTPASPGSSGGGVFDAETGKYVGMVVRGAESTFILTVPSRDIVRWADEHGFDWAVYPEKDAPSDEELNKVFPVVGIVPNEEYLSTVRACLEGKSDRYPIASKNRIGFTRFVNETDGKVIPAAAVKLDPEYEDRMATAMLVLLSALALYGLYQVVRKIL